MHTHIHIHLVILIIYFTAYSRFTMNKSDCYNFDKMFNFFLDLPERTC